MAEQPTTNPATLSPGELGITAAQMRVLGLLMQGKSNKAICRGLGLAEPTVKRHVSAILKALKVSNRTEAALAINAFGWDFRDAGKAGSERTGGPSPERPTVVANSKEYSPPGLPDEPSIVVLPFANLSGDPAQDYFADGMVDEITVALGRIPRLFVIASNSAFAYRGRAVGQTDQR